MFILNIIFFLFLEFSTLSSGPFSPSTIKTNTVDSSQQQEDVKPSIESHREESKPQILTVKSEPLWDESILGDRNSEIDWNIDMDAKAVLEACKYVQLFQSYKF